jgi:hypothetical protein
MHDMHRLEVGCMLHRYANGLTTKNMIRIIRITMMCHLSFNKSKSENGLIYLENIVTFFWDIAFFLFLKIHKMYG